MADKSCSTVNDIFERALENILARVAVCTPDHQQILAVAYSGGLDSSALLYLAADYAQRHHFTLFAFHIHHGISANADQWLAHCERETLRLQLGFDAARITLKERPQSGTEEAARIGRYAALGDLCRTHRAPILLTAHHQDDQAETVLLQLLRGSGVAGLAGMEQSNVAPGLLGADVVVARPLLAVSRAQLTAFVAQHGIDHIDDESNSDLRYTRNALRHRVLPAFAAQFPGFQARIARTAQHAESAQRLLNELAAQDLTTCIDQQNIDIEQLRLLSIDRIDNVLRYWFHQNDIRMPSTSWLSEMRQQLLSAKADAQLCVTHRDCEIRRYRGRAYLCTRGDDQPDQIEPVSFRWNGEASIGFPEFGGTLHFDRTESGIDADWLRSQSLMLRYRHGGERLKLAENRPTKSLKHHYQALQIPSWQRQRLPLIESHGKLLFAAGIGTDCHFITAVAPVCLQLRWEAEDH